MTEGRNSDQHALHIGKIVLYLAHCHEPGDYVDGAVNDPIVNIVDKFEPAHVLLHGFAEMDAETARGIVSQLYDPV
jgi:hypothetical protein